MLLYQIIDAIQECQTVKATDMIKYKKSIQLYYHHTENTEMVYTSNDNYGYWVLICPTNDMNTCIDTYLDSQSFRDDDERAYSEELLYHNMHFVNNI